MTVEETVPTALDGERLDRVVAIITGASRADAAQLVANGGARVDEVVVTSGKLRLVGGQSLAIDPSILPHRQLPQPDPSVQVVVVHADADVIVVNKAAGQIVHPGAGHGGSTLVNGLLALFPEIAGVGQLERPGIVHRLDVGTSGLMMVARTSRSYDSLVAALTARDVGRRYRALVWGHPANRHGVVDAPIGRDHREPMKMAVVVDGKPARTHYRVLRRYSDVADVAELECRLETGRTHQIRVHLAAIGHPVVGDGTYGGGRAQIAAVRPFLHAEMLSFRHPVSGAEMVFESELTDDLQQLLDGLGAALAVDE